MSAGTGPNAGVAVIGSVDHSSAPRFVHDGAIYMHEGQTYQVQRLDLETLRADVYPVAVDFYTEASTETEVQVLAEHDRRQDDKVIAAWGDVEVTSQVIGYRRIMRHTHTTLSVQPLDYPPGTMATSAYWLSLLPETQAALERAGLWHDSINNYGPNWEGVRAAVRARDHYRCTQCRTPEPRGQEHDVHHLTPFRVFGYIPGVNDHYLLANRLENLVLVCRSCHQRIETAGRLRTGMDGLAYILANLAPLHLMCDRSDINLHVARSESHFGGQPKPPTVQSARGRADSPAGGVPIYPLSPTADVDFMMAAQYDLSESNASALPDGTAIPSPGAGQPQLATIYLYEQIPAGLGFSAALFDLHDTLLVSAHRQISACTCRQGCPACVGPVLDDQPLQLDTRRLTLGVLEVLLAQQRAQ
jgi:DEAD/DEAH box helicase domain-containing protein